MLLEEIQRCVGIVERVVLAVGLVEQDADVLGDLGDELGDVGQGDRGRRGVVGVADDHQPRRGGDLGQHCVEVVLLGIVERHLDLRGAGRGGQMRVDAERGPRVDQLGARL